MSEVLEFVIEGKDQFSQVFEKLLHQLPLIGSVAAVAGAGLMGASAAIVKVVEKTAEAGEHIYNMSQRLGLSAKFVQEIGAAAYMADVPVDMMERSLSRLSINLAEATYKSGPAKDAFRELGVTLFDNAGRMKSAEQVYPEVANAIAKIGSASRQAELAGALFGIRSIEMLQMLKKGSAGFDEATRAAEKYGSIMGADLIENSKKFADTTKETSLALAGIRNEIAERVMPVITGLVMKINDWLADNRGLIGAWAEKIIRSVFYVYEVISRVFEAVGRTIGNVLAALSSPEAFKLFAANAWEAFKSVVMIAYEAVGGIGNAVNIVIGGSFMGLVNIASWVWEKVKEIFGGKEITESFGDVLKKSGEDISTAMEQLWKEMPDRLEPHLETLKMQIQTFLGTDLFTDVGETVDKMIAELKRLGTAGKEAVKELAPVAASTFEQMRGIWNDWFGTFQTGTQMMQGASKALWGTFSQGVGDAFGQAIVYGKSFSAAMTELWKKLASQVISALVQIGITQVAQMIIGQTIAMSEATARMATLTAELFMAAAASTAAIPIVGPAMAIPVATAVTGASLAAAASWGAAGGSLGAGLGMAHAGASYIPEDATYILKQGERVLSPNQNQDLTSFLNGTGPSGGGGIRIDKIEIVSPMIRQNWDEVMRTEFVPALNRALRSNYKLKL
jgi:hypothetical protein